ncbi:putative PTS system transcriptional antiterminator [Klebsiella michiganensis]|uniref:Putative PTS system transcriptional antiterminator n=1 Tax=Klebsiella michiganensis TaxID=1134687 RepID=A0A7H4M3P5_9ENTR|nr:putative PTS system transcriptional antiterminator [Klebsiella michiganensis]
MSPAVLSIPGWTPGSYKALVHYFGEDDVLFVQSLLQEMERKLCWSLGEPYYVNIFTHILIMMYPHYPWECLTAA